MSQTTNVPDFTELRRLVMDDAVSRTFKGGRLQAPQGPGRDGSRSMRRELMYAALAAQEFADPDGPCAGDERLRDAAVVALESNAERFDGGPGAVGDPGAFFLLVSHTSALLSLQPHVEPAWHSRLVERGVWLFDAAAATGRLTHEYLNARALETVSCLNLHRLTGDQRFLDRCVECLDNLIARQYPCGAQPYHTGLWVWGRRPAQVYQFLCGSMMLYVGRELGRDDAVECVRRIMDYSLRATNRRGEAFVASFEGLHKARTLSCANRQWVLGTVLGDKRFGGLARRTYEIWAEGVVGFCRGRQSRLDATMRENFPLETITEALHMGVREAPRPAAFGPPGGVHAFEDISTLLVHEPHLDVAMSLLSGYSALAEADCGDVKLFAVTPELSDRPTFSSAGTDALRAYWQKPSEQIECSAVDGRGVLAGWVYTKWDKAGTKDFRFLHNRRLAVTMTYGRGELILEYETLKNWLDGPVPCRLLFLLIARPFSAAPRLRIGGEVDVQPPPADSEDTFLAEAAVGPVRFSAPDGSAIEIVPELSTAECVTAERPEVAFAPGAAAPGRPSGHSRIKPANEGSLRVAFEGPGALDRGRYRIRFLPAGRT